jgi:hypothetical protein
MFVAPRATVVISIPPCSPDSTDSVCQEIPGLVSQGSPLIAT